MFASMGLANEKEKLFPFVYKFQTSFFFNFEKWSLSQFNKQIMQQLEKCWQQNINDFVWKVMLTLNHRMARLVGHICNRRKNKITEMALNNIWERGAITMKINFKCEIRIGARRMRSDCILQPRILIFTSRLIHTHTSLMYAYEIHCLICFLSRTLGIRTSILVWHKTCRHLFVKANSDNEKWNEADKKYFCFIKWTSNSIPTKFKIHPQIATM